MNSETNNTTLREQARRDHPDFPWLDVGDRESLVRLLTERHWLREGEEVESFEPPGDGNMNLILRVKTGQRSFIVKQSRPWVEKYDTIAAPWDRMLFEQRFYRRVSRVPGVAQRMPRVLAADPDARVIVLEDMGDAADFTDLYRGWAAYDRDVRTLAGYLRALHDASEGEPDPEFANREMRALNRQHIFVIPLDSDNGIDLDGHELWLNDAANRLRSDAAYVERVSELGERYLADGNFLLHGDYFPGSWLRAEDGLRVIDPEFCFFGDREWDLGVCVAHLRLASQDFDFAKAFLSAYQEDDIDTVFDVDLVRDFAAVEIMRRLLGVAQLPIPPSQGFRAELLAASRTALLGGDIEDLWV